jgi:hypothetical protein
MKIAEFFGRAFEDATYRREKLEQLRYFKKVCIGGICVSAVAGVVVTVSTSVSGERWDARIFQWLMPVVICAWSYSTCVTRIAALETFERGPNQSLQTTPGAVTPPAGAGGAPSPSVSEL